MCVCVICFGLLFTVHFRYVVFRPFIEEVLIGKVKNYSKEGIHGEIPENLLNVREMLCCIGICNSFFYFCMMQLFVLRERCSDWVFVGFLVLPRLFLLHIF